MRRWFQLALLLACTSAVLTAVPAVAAPSPGLAEAAGGRFPDRVYVLTLPTVRPLSARDLRVRENGQPVTSVSVVPAANASESHFGVVLVVDASNSMKGKAIAAALQAAQRFVGHRTPMQQVAVMTFNDQSEVIQPFTTDSTAVVAALAHRPQLAFGTHLYDAVGAAVGLLKEANISAGSVVVLSDGADTGSASDKKAVLATAREAHARIFTVALRSPHDAPGALRALADGAGGEFTEASSLSDLSRIYDALGTRLSHEYLLRYRSLQSLGEKVSVTVRVQGLDGTAKAGYAAPSLPLPPAPVTHHRAATDSFWTSSFTMIVFTVLAGGLVSFCVLILLMPRRRTLQKRLAEFVSLAQPGDGTSLTQTSSILTAEAEDSPLEKSPFWQRFVEEVELAEIQRSPTQIAFWTLGATFLVMWLSALLLTFAALLLGFLVPLAVWTVVHRKVEKKRANFAEQLPDNLAVLASALRAGHSFVGALSVVVDDAPEPAQSEFRRVVADEQLGRPLEEALDLVVKRMDNKDLAQVSLVAALQRQTGGSTAEVLDRVVETVRERQEVRRLIKTLTAAGRMSRWVVSALPLVLLLAITILNPGYLDPLFAHTSGRILFGLATALVISGSLVIKRIVDIKV